MLRITVELVPYGDESQKSTLSQFEIVNTGRLPHKGSSFYHVRKSAQYPEPIVKFTHRREDGLNVCVERAFFHLSDNGLDKI